MTEERLKEIEWAFENVLWEGPYGEIMNGAIGELVAEVRRLQLQVEQIESRGEDEDSDALCKDCGATPGDGLTQGWWCLYCKKGVPPE